jgi:hypothetical protein
LEAVVIDNKQVESLCDELIKDLENIKFNSFYCTREWTQENADEDIAVVEEKVFKLRGCIE